jgi:peptidoglycan biosynthesis protein MviN/MurJ (putative lipid II flippase)
MDFPITVRDFLSIAGISLFAGLVVQWLKEWITEKRLLNLWRWPWRWRRPLWPSA